MEEQRTANVVLSADVSNYQQNVGAAQDTTTKLGTSIDAISTKLANLNKVAGKGLAGFGAGTLAGLTGATMAAGKFEKSLSTLAAQSAITNKNMGTLTSTVKNLSKDFPVSLNQASQLVTMLSQMGVVSEQQINRMASTLTRLSGATGTDLLAVSSGLVELGRTMGTLNTNNMEKYANSLVNVSANSGVAAQSVLEFSNAIGPVARLAGMTEQQVLGISGAFSKAGADGYAGATAFNRMVYGLTRTLQFGGPELKTYSNLLGVTTDQLRGMDTGEAVLQIFESLNKQGPLAIKTLDSLGLDGLRTIRSIQAVINQGNLRQSVNQAISGDPNSLTKGAEAAFGGINDQLERFGTNIQQFGIAIGQNLTTPLEGAFAVANQLMSVMNAIASSPIGTAAAYASGGIGALATTAGLGLLGAGAISKLVAGGMGAGVLRAGWGGMRLGQGMETPAAIAASRTLDRAREATGMARFRPSFLFAQGGYALGQQMGAPDAEGPGRMSRWAAMPVRAANWMTQGQISFLRNSELMQQGPLSRAGGVVGESFKDFRNAMGMSSAASRAATAETIGLSKATGNLTRSLMLLGATYGRAGVATAGMGLRGLGGLAMGALGPVGLAIAGGTGAVMAAQYAGGLAAQRTENYGTLGANLYAVAAGRSGTASTSTSEFSISNPLPPASSRGSAAMVSSSEYQRTLAPDFELTDPALAGMSADEAKRYVLSLGYLPAGDMQMVGQDLASLFGQSTANEILSESLKLYPKQGSALRNMVKGGLPASITQKSGATPSNAAINPGMFVMGTAFGTERTTYNPFSKDFWAENFGGLTSQQSQAYETAWEQVGAQTSEIEKQYGTDAGQAFKLLNMYQMMSQADTGVERNKIESLTGGDWNYPGLDPSRRQTVSQEDLKSAFLGRTNESGQTYGQYFNSLGFTFNPDIAKADSNYTYIDLNDPNDRRRAMLELMRSDPSQSGFQATALGGYMSRPKMTMQIAQEDANTQLQTAQQLLAYADRQEGGAATALRAARGETSSQSPDFGALSLAMQLEQRRFDQNLASQNMNSWTTQQAQIARTTQMIGALNPNDENYQQDLMAFQDQLMQQRTALNDHYEQVILAKREFDVSMERSEEDYQLSRARAIEDYNRQVEYAYEDFYRNRRRSQEDFQRSMDRMVEDSMSQVYDPYQRITTQPTLDAQNLMINIREQNQALEQQEKNLRRLKRAGLDQATIDFLGLADPKNAQQLARLVADMRNNPALIREMNKLTEGREEGTQGLVASHWSRQYRRAVEDFERQSRRAREDFQRQMDRNNEMFDLQLSRMAADHKRMVDRALEDFNRQFKEVTGKFGDIEQRALGILADAGVKVVSTGERQMDKIIASLTRKYNFTQRMIDRLTGMNTSGVGGGGGTGSGPSGGPGTGVYAGSTGSVQYGGATLRVNDSGSSSTAPTFQPRTRADAEKLSKKENRRLSKREKLLRVAYNQLGKPYNHVGDGHDGDADSFDCSGLTYYAAKEAGLSLSSGNVSAQWAQLRKVSKPIPGDIVSFDTDRNHQNGMNHTGIYIGNGRLIHANRPGGQVGVGNISDQPFSWHGFGRIPGLAHGGIHRGPKLVGEGDFPETVIPLNDRGHQFMLSMYKSISREMVKEMVTKQLRVPAMGQFGGSQYINASTNFNGDITVKADDPRMMLKKLEAEKRRANLLSPSKAKS